MLRPDQDLSFEATGAPDEFTVPAFGSAPSVAVAGITTTPAIEVATDGIPTDVYYPQPGSVFLAFRLVAAAPDRDRSDGGFPGWTIAVDLPSRRAAWVSTSPDAIIGRPPDGRTFFSVVLAVRRDDEALLRVVEPPSSQSVGTAGGVEGGGASRIHSLRTGAGLAPCASTAMARLPSCESIEQSHWTGR